MKKPVLIGILLFAALIGLIVYSSIGTSANRVEVCMQYDGRVACRTAAGSTKDFALRAATSNACAQIASGVTDTIKCEHADPVRVTWK
ncbi:MAG: hypothetical protein LAO79_03715 [Acidobacteriia bacterium]|nr:hypothetical protein [Terriglobia bacterium]